MASKRHLLVICLLAFVTVANAQISAKGGTEWKDSSLIPASRMAQHNEFLNNQYLFPAKPRSQWELGFKVGAPTINGDVAANFPNFGYGLHLRKSIGYLVSIRGEFYHGTPTGLNWKSSSNYEANPAWAPNYSGNVRTYGGTGAQNVQLIPATDMVYYNYKTNLNDLSVQMLFNLSNVRFHKAEPKFSFYGLVGLGLTTFTTKVDALNASGAKYNFNSISGNVYANRKATKSALKALLDGTYETKGESDGGTKAQLSTTFGFGGAFKLSKRVNISFEDRIGYVKNDLLDGQRWSENPRGDAVLTSDFDSFNFLSVGLNFNIF